MSALYPDYKPRGIRREWEHCSMEKITTGETLVRYGAPKDWGNPTDAVAWFAGDYLRVLVADYDNGKRVTLRLKRGEFTLTTEPRP